MANDFSGDASFISVYNMESGALGTDSIGANTMVANDSLPNEESVDFKQGSGCGDFVAAVPDGMNRSTINMIGAPFQDNSSRVGTFFTWFKCTDFSTFPIIMARFSSLINQRAFAMALMDDGTPTLYMGHNNGNSTETITMAAHQLTLNEWVHMAISYDITDDGYHMRVWDEADTTVYDIAGTTANTMDINLLGSFSIGSAGNKALPFNGLIDESGFNDRVLTSEEIDRIRGGTFPFGAAAAGNALFLGSNF